MKEIRISANDASQRADKFLQKAFPTLPMPLMYKAFRKKDIKINGKHIKEDTILVEGDILRIYLPDDALLPKKDFTPVFGTIDFVYEDENIAIIDKPEGVPCQNGQGGMTPLCDIFKTVLYNRKEYNPKSENSFAPALCNRIDTNTKGLVIGAKNAAALRTMNNAIKNRLVHKFYLCKTEGFPPRDEDTVFLTLKKDEVANKVFEAEKGMETQTYYKVLSRNDKGAICEIELLSGKSHQIRAVMSHLGCPLVGDAKYGAATSGGQSLISYKLTFSIDDPLLSYLNDKTFVSSYKID